MDSENWLIVGAVALGGYAIYKVLGNKGVEDTTSAVADVATSTAGLFKQTAGIGSTILTETQSALDSGITSVKSGRAIYDLNPFVQANKVIVDTTTSLFKTPQTSTLLTTSQVDNTPYTTNIGITKEGALFSSAKPLVANVSTSSGMASQTNISNVSSKSSTSTIGAKAGTIFSSGASVKSVGASGKYKTGF